MGPPETKQHRGYEFGGPIGALGIILGTPAIVYSFAFFCNDISGCPPPSLLHPSTLSIESLKAEIGWPQDGIKGLYDGHVMLCVLGYYALNLALQIFLPGREVDGEVLACGKRLKYKFNAFNSSVLILLGCATGTYIYGVDFPLWTFLWDNYVQVITSNLVICTVLAVLVYLYSFSVPAPGEPNPMHRELAPGGQTRSGLYNFFIGRELNPRIKLPIPFLSDLSRTIDIKVFCELRPGLLGWVIMNLSNIAHQYKVTSGNLTSSILLVAAFQGFYVFDGLYMEPAICTTMDVIMDGFGFMLSFGDLVWVPFIYSIHTRYLAVFPLELGAKGVALVLGVQTLGYYIFRGANNQKDRFRKNPNDPRVKHLQYIQTSRGSKLITSGWWGAARHINYLGDWTMAWATCLPTGVAGYAIAEKFNPLTRSIEKQAVQTSETRGWGMIVTYFYIVYFGILLIHRERRDEEKCRNKYGADWVKYTSKVKSRIIPGIY
ncbi:erg24, C-14 sterol reductase [Ophidiomyces ophidiicola]|nr:erg24, C-14 sterol reductase [Ophidiomyces ophidiicola]KAI1939010.1 erg24, C-14 sterol reductase [Ophidiomyces ophidiicola]KAI1961979.1 erg24, C-14 sterol reductase [Ophidiomyces ophidiicola]